MAAPDAVNLHSLTGSYTLVSVARPLAAFQPGQIKCCYRDWILSNAQNKSLSDSTDSLLAMVSGKADTMQEGAQTKLSLAVARC